MSFIPPMLIPDFSGDDSPGSGNPRTQHSSTVSPFKGALLKGAMFICYPAIWLVLLLCCIVFLLLFAAYWLAIPFAKVTEREGKPSIDLPWEYREEA